MSDYKYSWKPSSDLSLDEYLQKYKPTMVVDDGTKPWIWVRRLEHEPLDSATPDDSCYDGPAVERAQKLLEEYTEKIAAIQKDDSIPIRANKKKGLRSKKEVREEVMAEATGKFRQLSEESKLTSGKWLFFVQPDQVDGVFARLARDLVTGDLSKTSAFSAKVATTPPDVGPNHRYLICLYLPDLYDKTAATEVLRVACQSTGVRPNSAKADVYTIIGLDSKHPSGIKSTIWNPTELVTDAELKTLTEAYWSNASKKSASSDTNPTEGTSANDNDFQQKATKRPRKAEDSDDDDVFDNAEPTLDEDAGPLKPDGPGTKSKGRKALLSKGTSKGAKAPSQHDSATESESDDPPPSKPTAPITKKPVPPKVNEASSSDEDVKKPKKVRRF